MVILVSATEHTGDSYGGGVRKSYPRSLRLLRHADFERVYQQGRRHFSAHMTVFYLRREDGGTRVGYTVSRVLGNAVVRNRMKRRLREAVRLGRPNTNASVDIVINPKKSLLHASFDDLLNQIERAFSVAQRAHE